MRGKKLKKAYQAVQDKTGIDFEEYKDDEWAGQIADLIAFPQYALSVILKGPGILLLAWAIATWLCFHFGHVAFGVPFAILGFILAIANGLILGCIWLVYSITGDVNSLFDLTLLKVRQIYDSIREGGDEVKAGLIDITKGVVFAMLLPDLVRIVSKKIPILGGLVAAVASRLVATATATATQRLEDGLTAASDAATAEPEPPGAVLEKVMNTTDTITEGAATIAAFPFKLSLWIVGALSVIIIGILYLILF